MKRILITGASSGIGRQLASDYAQQGHQVIACARSSEALASLAKLFPDNIQAVQVDVSLYSDVVEKFSEITDLDLVILNAGTCEYVDIDKFDAKLFERVFQVNVLGVVYCLEALLPKLAKNRTDPKSQVAIVDSQARLLPFTRSAAYGSSKAAVHYLAKSLAVDLDGRDISIHSVSPGFVKTPLTDKNDFSMPFLISVEEAAKRIIAGLKAGRAEISFPRRLSWILTICSLLPESLQHKINVHLREKS